MIEVVGMLPPTGTFARVRVATRGGIKSGEDEWNRRGGCYSRTKSSSYYVYAAYTILYSHTCIHIETCNRKPGLAVEKMLTVRQLHAQIYFHDNGVRLKVKR